jgi:hypothetical protein
MAPVGPTQCETRWKAVLASFDKQYEALIDKNPDATKEINIIRTGIIKIGQLIQTSPQKNGNGATWKRLIAKAESEKSVLCKHFDGKVLFTGMLRLYTATHRETEESLFPECAQGKERLSPTANVEKEIKTLTTVAVPVRGSRQKNVDHYRSTKSHGQW